MKSLWLPAAAVGLCGWLVSGSSAQEELPREPVPVVGNSALRIAEQGEPLTRGPVHEAFAQAVTPAAETGLLINKEPPPLIDEIPPSQRPAGDDIAWIPGYWGWDDDRKDFIWISGIWRAVPPGREWVPGYWARATDGIQWVSGYWADIRSEEVEYLPAPPETVDAGPNAAAPTGDEIWIPGCWMWQQNKYVWRAGYWAKGNPRWLWTNSHYVYTPRGYLYVSGYWDFVVPQRGVLFAPVYFQSVPQNYVYSPRVVVNTVGLIDHLFLRPTYRHYYFGDYYAANYRGRGILPYFVFNDSRNGYDSIYSYYRWQNRNDRNWDQQVHARYEKLRDHEDGRPPRDYAAWREYRDRDDARGGQRDNRNPLLINSVQDYSKLQGHDWKFRDIDDQTRQTVGRHSHDLDTYRQSRIKQESERAAVRTGEDNRGGDKVRLLKPPTGAEPDNKQPTRTERDPATPRIDRPITPRVDPQGPAGGRASDGTVPPREAPKNPRELPGPLNDIRNRDDRKDPLDPPKPPRDRPGTPGKAPGPLNDLRDPPRDVPKATPAPRDIPKVAPLQREAPKAAPPQREPPRANPQPAPRPERPQGGNKGNGNPGGGNPGKGKEKN